MYFFHYHFIFLLFVFLPSKVSAVEANAVFSSALGFWTFNELYDHPTIPGILTTPDSQNVFNGLVTSQTQYVSLAEGVVNNSISIDGMAVVLLGDVSGSCLGAPEVCTTGLSVAMWIHINSSQADPCTVLTTGADTGGSRGIHIKYQGSVSGLLKFYVHNGAQYWSYDADISTVQSTDFWNHMGFVWNATASGALTVFVNGQEVGAVTSGVDDVIGSNVDNTIYLNGNTQELENCVAQYDELAIWEVGLDEFDIFAVYQDGIPPVIVTTLPPISTVMSTQSSTTNIDVANEHMSSLEKIYIELASDSLTPTDVSTNTEELASLTTANQNMTSQELSLTLDILDQISGLHSYMNADVMPTLEEKEAIRNSFVKTINELVHPSKSDAWNVLVANNSDVSFRLMHTVDNFADNLLSDLEFQDFTILEENMEMQGLVGLGDDDIYIKLNRGDDLVVVPASAFRPEASSHTVVATVVYELPRLVNNRVQSESNETTILVNSAIISIDIGESVDGPFKNDVRMYLKMNNGSFSAPECVFLGDNNQWASEGCELVSFTGLVTECHCNHLTNFAVLMSVTPVELSDTDRLALQIITYVGCCISLICLLLALVLLLFLRELSSSRITILKNLIVALLLAEVLFVTGVSATQNDMLCSVIAILLHYFYLSVFCWMLVQGIQLLIKIRKVFDSNIRVLHFCLLGWGLPALVVCVTLGIDHHGYGTATHCWLSAERFTIWAFVGPAIGVILVNTVVLVMVIRVFMSVKSNKDKTEVQKFRSGLRATALLLPLLGLTWAFGLLSIDESTVAFQYIFALLNSLQGLFIFVFHCVMNDEVKGALNTRHQKLVSQSEGESSFFTKIMRTGRTAVRPDESSSVTHSTRATATATAM